MEDRLRHHGNPAKVCVAGSPEEVLKKNAFFLGPTETKASTIKLLAYANKKQLALLRTSAAFGKSYLVVLKRADNGCWKFQSIGLKSINN